MLPCLSLLCVAVFGPASLVPDGPRPPAASVQAYGRGDPACQAWSDGCVTCQAAADGGPARCSTPGIACTPEPVACRAR